MQLNIQTISQLTQIVYCGQGFWYRWADNRRMTLWYNRFSEQHSSGLKFNNFLSFRSVTVLTYIHIYIHSIKYNLFHIYIHVHIANTLLFYMFVDKYVSTWIYIKLSINLKRTNIIKHLQISSFTLNVTSKNRLFYWIMYHHLQPCLLNQTQRTFLLLDLSQLNDSHNRKQI